MIDSERLVLRRWRDADREPFHALCQSHAVMAYMGGLLDRAESDAAIDRMTGYQTSLGYCIWAVERRRDGVLLGMCGLKPGVIGPIAGAVEIGWRFHAEHWGRGYAREAAEASLAWGWANLDCARIVAITVAANTRSWGLMERLGMERHPALDFDHPAFADGHPLRRHVTYVAERPTA